jgi:hypothetical protein
MGDSKRLKSNDVYYSMKVVVHTNSFIHQEISEGGRFIQDSVS